MNPLVSALPFRLGTTSYIIPDEILPNARYLAGKVRDIELVLFELDDGPSNLPDDAVTAELNAITAEHGMSYTVHLPLDLRLGADGEAQHISLVKARRVIEATRAVDPWAYVLHLDGKEVRGSADPQALSRWQDQAVRALEIVAGWAGEPERLAVENLEGYPLDFWEPVFARIPVSRCVDIGHLWLDGHDPLPYLAHALPTTRVIHLHGIGTRDHQSLAHTAPDLLAAALRPLMEAPYRGVLTLEIFNEDDLHTSLAAFAGAIQPGAAG
jgi:sugar phosphate isomerase/epimerase